MKKQNVFLVAVLTLALVLTLVGSVGAAGEVGFYIDCAGAYGYGWVAAHTEHTWVVGYHNPGEAQPTYWEGTVYGGDFGAPFDVTILWPTAPVAGESYYWVWIDGTLVQEGHFECPPPPPPCGACTPGYWKNLRKHGDEWDLTPYSPGDDFDTTFSVDLFDPDITLDEAVHMGGGGIKKLARHGTAALLNAAHPGVDYPLTVDQVILAVQLGYGDALADWNEDLDCPLN